MEKIWAIHADSVSVWVTEVWDAWLGHIIPTLPVNGDSFMLACQNATNISFYGLRGAGLWAHHLAL